MVTYNTTGTTGTNSTTGATAGQNQNSDLKNDLNKSKEEMAQSVKGTRYQVTQEASDQARTKAEGAKGYAADEMDSISHAAQAAADALQDEHHEKLSAYVGDMAGYVGEMASNLKNKNVDDLVSDAKRMAHKNPTLFIAGGIALGLGIARIAKAGAARTSEHHADTRSLPSSSSEFNDSTNTGSASGLRGSSSSLSSTTSPVNSSSTTGSSSVGGSFSSNGGSTASPSSTSNAGSLNSGFNTKSSQYDKV